MKMNRAELALFTLVWLAILAAVACGGEPPLIDAPDKIDAYRLVDAKITGTWESALWAIEPEAGVDLRLAADGKSLIFVAPPGSYTVRVVVVNFTAKKINQGKRIVVIGKGPDPGPGPNPPPPPPPGKLLAVVVEEQSARTAQQALVMGSARVRSLFSLFRQCDQHVKDRDDKPPADLKPYLDIAKGQPLPYLIIADLDTGLGYWKGAFPTTIEEVEKIVKELKP